MGRLAVTAGLPSRLALYAGMVVASLSLAAPCVGQQAAKQVRIGYLTPVAQPDREAALRRELRRFGYVDGGNVTIEYRSAEGSFDRLPALARQLAELKVDVMLAVVTQAAIAARNATGTIPIVMVGVADPVGAGLVASLARPGGNVTGTSTVAADVVGKQLEVLRELLPTAVRVTVLSNPANPVFQKRQMAETIKAARKLQVEFRVVEMQAADGLERAFAAITTQRTDALFVMGDPLFTAEFARIAALAVKHRLPTIGAAAENAVAGALITYGPDYAEAYRRAAWYVGRILGGERPGALPVEQSTKFELVVNARTAKAIGVAIPRSLVARADRVLE